MKIAVIGAGASGIIAALQAAWQGASVTLFERNNTIGRKLLVTGSGRCNITNDQVSPQKYTCADSQWMAILLSHFGVDDLLKMLKQIGIPVYNTSDGWYYPLSNSARSVVDAMESALRLSDVSLQTASQVIDFHGSEHGFSVRYIHTANHIEDTFDKLILSAGGKAYPTLGSKGELFPSIGKSGHTILPIRPALAPVLAELGTFKSLKGIRLDVGVTLWHQDRKLAETSGNLIFTEWGLNGPAVMDISHHISANPELTLTLSLDLLKYFEPEFNALLTQKRHTEMPTHVFLEAFFPSKVAVIYTKMAGMAENTALNQIPAHRLTQLINILRDTCLAVRGVRSFNYCQVSIGGVPVTEVSPETMQSSIIEGLYLTGETLDVVGPCGGYNLHYAFASGALAGIAAAQV